MARVVLAWLEGDTLPRDRDDQDETVDLFSFLSARVDEVCARLLAGQAGPLAALPAWSDGLIDVLQPPAGPLDLVQALLRLHPEASLAEGLAGENLDAARFALGASVPIGPTPCLWAAAARARHPFSDCPEVESRHPGLGQAFDCELRIGERHGHWWAEQKPSPTLRRRRNLPTNLIWTWDAGDTPPDRRWEALIWPNGRRAWWARGWLAIGNNLDWWEADWAAIVYLESLLEPRPLDAHGRRLLALGLAAKEPGQSGLAVDALSRALSEARVTVPELAASFAELGPLSKPNRWARTLGEVARLSHLHAVSVHELLERHLALTAPAGNLLELLVELGARLQKPLQDPAARRALESLKGSGKTARLAKMALST